MQRVIFCSIVHQISGVLSNTEKIQIRSGIGNIVPTLWDAKQSALQAVEVLDHMTWTNNGAVTFYSDLDKQNFGYYYPIAQEQELINLVKMGKANETRTLLEEIFNENIRRIGLSSYLLSQLSSEIRGTALKLFSMLSNSTDEQFRNLLSAMKHSTTENELRRASILMFEYLCDIVQQYKRSHNEQLLQSILSFVAQEYKNPNLSLTLLASKFSMSEKYLSNFFRDQIGESFSSYLEAIRMKNAIELLRNGMAIEKISMVVGYNSANTFYRAFKRSHGVSPSDYRREL